MSVGRICVRTVHVARPEESVRQAARRMREADVGALIVVDDKRSPIGIVTDRDLAVRCLAEDRDADATPVATIMTWPALCVAESMPIEDAIRRMAGIAARRLAVTDEDGQLVGVLALDDVIELLVEEAESIGRLVQRRQLQHEA